MEIFEKFQNWEVLRDILYNPRITLGHVSPRIRRENGKNRKFFWALNILGTFLGMFPGSEPQSDITYWVQHL